MDFVSELKRTHRGNLLEVGDDMQTPEVRKKK
jgi:hypothetical protein